MDIVCAQDGLFGFVGCGVDFLDISLNAVTAVDDEETGAAMTGLPSIPQLLAAYYTGVLTPVQLVDRVYDRIDKHHRLDPAVWISRRSRESVLAAADALSKCYAERPLPPLFGVPFAVKDNIDVRGEQTTAGCPSYSRNEDGE